jgi:hypothetical protein
MSSPCKKRRAKSGIGEANEFKLNKHNKSPLHGEKDELKCSNWQKLLCKYFVLAAQKKKSSERESREAKTPKSTKKCHHQASGKSFVIRSVSLFLVALLALTVPSSTAHSISSAFCQSKNFAPSLLWLLLLSFSRCIFV